MCLCYSFCPHAMPISPERPAPRVPMLLGRSVPSPLVGGLNPLPPLTCKSGLHGGECVLWYFKPFKFLYLFWQISHLYGFSFSIPMVPGYGADVSGLTIEKVPSALSWSLWLLWPCWKFVSDPHDSPKVCNLPICGISGRSGSCKPSRIQ